MRCHLRFLLRICCALTNVAASSGSVRPSIAVSSNYLHLVYADPSGHLMYQRRALAGGSWSTALVIDDTTSVSSPQISTTAGDIAHVAWATLSRANILKFQEQRLPPPRRPQPVVFALLAVYILVGAWQPKAIADPVFFKPMAKYIPIR